MTNINDYNKFASLRQKKIRNGGKLSHSAVEKPMMKKMIPNLKNKTVLLLGCGTGEESIMIKKAGAKKIIGIDISKESIEIANKTYPEHEFLTGNMHKLKFKNNYFDFVYSSLTLHYSNKQKTIYNEIMRVLKPKGLFLFSVGHPLKWGSQKINIKGEILTIIGYSETKKSKKIYGNYLSFKEKEYTFPSGEVLKFWVGPPSFYFKKLKDSNFIIKDFVESKAITKIKKDNPWCFERNNEFPRFMAFLAQKP